MDTLNQDFVWLGVTSGTAEELSGSFMTLLEGVPCTLELTLRCRSLRGSLSLDGECFEIKGVFSSQTRTAYAVLVEPMCETPIALLKITAKGWDVVLELDMPDVEVLSLCKTRTFRFQSALSFLASSGFQNV